MFDGDLIGFFTAARWKRRLHFTSFDPAKHTLAGAREIALLALDVGTDGFLLGGSTGVDKAMVEDYCGVIRAVIDGRFLTGPRPPLVLFPSSAATGVAAMADGVLFLSLLNSADVRFLIREQAKAAPYLPALDLQPVGCGMICIEPGGTAAKVGKADLIRRDDWQTAVGYAAAAAAFGFRVIYLNAGSGSRRPVSTQIVEAIAQIIKVPLIVGGGLTDAGKVAAVVNAGADIVITGTAIESNPDVRATLTEIIDAVHSTSPKDAEEGA